MNATVIQKNSFTYANCGGKSLPIPMGVNQDVLGTYWGVPVKDAGVFRGYDFVAYDSANKPTPDSIPIIRLADKETNDIYNVLGTQANLDASTADNGTTPMPAATTIPVVVPDYNVCPTVGGTDDGKYVWTFSVPDKTAGQEYRANVLVDNVQAVAAASAGHATIDLMVTWLNTNYSAAGTWTKVGTDKIKLVSTTDKSVGVTFVVGDFA